LGQEGVGCIAFSPLAQGQLTNRYIDGIPQDSRAAKGMTYLEKDTVQNNLAKIKSLHAIAKERNQSLSDMAIAWLLKDERVTSVLVGVSSAKQLAENCKALSKLSFDDSELKKIEVILANQ
jgi:L-glyceraldehyde 3-phosphate reductase